MDKKFIPTMKKDLEDTMSFLDGPGNDDPNHA